LVRLSSLRGVIGSLAIISDEVVLIVFKIYFLSFYTSAATLALNRWQSLKSTPSLYQIRPFLAYWQVLGQCCLAWAS